MAPRASLRTRLLSQLRGEVSAATLEKRRQAGRAAYSLAEELDAATADDRGTRLFKLCAWNALALQTIADTMLDADAAGDPDTAGFVKRSTLDFVGACLDGVPVWLRAARIVQSDPDANVAVPAALPKWVFSESTTSVELRALRAAYDALEPRVEVALNALATKAPDADTTRALRRLFAEMTSAAEYAQGLDDPSNGPVERGRVRWRLLDALGNAFLLGQLLAVPTLADIISLTAEQIDRPTMTAATNWTAIDLGCPVLDSTGRIVGHVGRVLGDRSTGVLAGIELDPGAQHASLHVPASQIGLLKTDEVHLSVPLDDLLER